jgi:preprotein translocase subunit SecG
MTPDSEFIDPNDGFPPLQPPRRPQVRVRGSVDFTAPLTSLAIAVRVLLAATIMATVALLPVLLEQRSTMQDFVAGSATLGDARNADRAASTVSNVATACFLLTAVVYLVWFYRARTNVEHYDPQFQRRSVGWALGGWLPIVSFWVPYQVTTDILLDSRQSLRARADVWRRPFGVVQAWWAAWLARYVFFLAERSAPSHTPHQFENLKLIEMGGALTQIVAGVLAILVVGAITNAQRERRAEWDAA